MSSVGSFLKRILPIVMLIIIIAVALGLFINFTQEEEMKKVRAKVCAEEKLAEQYSSNHYYNDGNGIKFWNENNTEYIKLAIESVYPKTIIVNGEAFMRKEYNDDFVYEFNNATLKVFFDGNRIGAWDITMIQYRPDYLSGFKTYYNKDLVRK